MRRLALALALLCATVAALSPAAPAAPFATDLDRIFGAERSLTAIEISKAGWTSSTEVVLATAQGFPDALGATPLAASLDAPLLLLRAGALTQPVLDEIARLGARRATILGGPQVVDPSVEASLRERGIEARRIAGADRYETAAAVAAEVGAPAKAQAVVASGEFFADALAAGSLSGGPDRLPVLLASMKDLPDVSLAALQRLGTREVLLIGGPGILGAEVENELKATGMAVARLAGPDRFATSARVATEAFARLGPDPVRLVTAAGTTFPDALAAGPFVARTRGVLLLVPPDDLGRAPEGVRFLRDRLARWASPTLLGGPSIVNGSVGWQLRAVLAGDPLPTAAFADATYRVGDGFQPGTYRTPPSTGGCYWERLRGFSGSPAEIITNDLSSDSMVVTVLPGDAGFRVSGCRISTADLTPASLSPADAARGPYPDGTWLVGHQIPPGNWRASGGQGCFWQRLAAFTGDPAAVVAQGAGSTVTLEPGDLGFRSRRCGAWSPA